MDDEMKRFALAAVNRLDALLERGADASHAEIKAAVDGVIAWRNRAIEKHRTGSASRHCLDKANSLASLAFGIEFPLSGFHLNRIRQTRDGLDAFLRTGNSAAV